MKEFLLDLVPAGYRALLFLEGFRSPLLDSFFTFITELGGEKFYIILLSILYWCVDPVFGLVTSYLYLLSTAFNSLLKHAIDIPRPDSFALESILDTTGITDRLNPLLSAENPSWPSNHTQGAFVTWIWFAMRVKRAWFWIFAVVTASLIAFSRAYGGVHFPIDLAGGFALAILILLTASMVIPPIQRILSRLPNYITLLTALLVPIMLLFSSSERDIAMVSGVLAGLGLGHWIQTRYIQFQVPSTIPRKILVAFVGVILVFLAYFAMSDISSIVQIQTTYDYIRAVRYFVLGVIATTLIPWIFIRTRLLSRMSS